MSPERGNSIGYGALYGGSRAQLWLWLLSSQPPAQDSVCLGNASVPDPSVGTEALGVRFDSTEPLWVG